MSINLGDIVTTALAIAALAAIALWQMQAIGHLAG